VNKEMEKEGGWMKNTMHEDKIGRMKKGPSKERKKNFIKN
jgi:hypothetical protein